jgi:hypothetical protein
VDAGLPDQGRFAHIAHGDNQAFRRAGISQGDHPRDVSQGAVQPELTAETKPLDAVGWKVTIRHQKAYGNGKIQAGATLLHT